MLPVKLRQASRSGRRVRWRRAPLLGACVALLGSGAAFADGSWTYVINFDKLPRIDESSQPGNYQIWGLGYARVIVGSQGSNLIVGDGACPPGSTDTSYCSVAPVKGSRNTVIYGNGSGQNVIYAGYGPSVIIGGSGPNIITSAPTSSLIIGGNGGDIINGNQGATVIKAGTGTNTIYALSPQGDTVYCTGEHDTVYAYTTDHVYNCANVIYRPGAPTHAGPRDRHFVTPTLRHDRAAQRLYRRLKAAERRAAHKAVHP